MIENVIYVLIGLASISIIANVSDNVLFSSQLRRGIGGVIVNLGSTMAILNYTNVVSFYKASSTGLLGGSGYLFIVANLLLAIVWIQNLVKYRQVIM